MVKPVVRQTLIALSVLTAMVGQGMIVSYPTSLLPALMAEDSPIPVDLQTGSWLASIVGGAAVAGYFLCSFFMDTFGRRNAQFLVLLPGIVGWGVVCVSWNVTSLIIGRFLGGIGIGGAVGLGAVAIGEYTSPDHRGMFLNLKTASVSFGSMVVHIMAGYLHWRTIAGIAIVPYIISFGLTFTWPESPAYLAYKKRYDKCRESFYLLRGRDEKSIKEVDDMIEAQRMHKISDKNMYEVVMEFLKKCKRRDFLKPLFIIFIATILLEVCGRHFFPAYAIDIVKEITGDKSHSIYYTLAIDLIITSSATCSSVLVRIMKRRKLLFSTGAAALVFLASACTYMFLVSSGTITGRNWIPMCLFVAYFILVNLGCTPIPLALLGELFPLAHRAAGSALGGVIVSLLMNFVVQITPFLKTSLRIEGMFAVYGVSTALCLIVLYFTLPETKDRTLQEIEDHFNKGKRCVVEYVNEEEAVRILENKTEIGDGMQKNGNAR